MISGILSAIAVTGSDVRRYENNIPVTFFHALNSHVAGCLSNACTHSSQHGSFDRVRVSRWIINSYLRINDAVDGLLYSLCV